MPDMATTYSAGRGRKRGVGYGGRDPPRDYEDDSLTCSSREIDLQLMVERGAGGDPKEMREPEGWTKRDRRVGVTVMESGRMQAWLGKTCVCVFVLFIYIYLLL